MVKERQPPRKGNGEHQPSFGEPSPIRNPLKQENASNIFLVPKQGQPRPEHHRPTDTQPKPNMSSGHGNHYQIGNISSFRQPSFTCKPRQNSPDFFEIPRPTNFVPPTIPAAQKPMFSTAASFQPANAFKPPKTEHIDLKKIGRDDDLDNGSGSSVLFKDDTYSSYDPLTYMDTEQANENIKALLEGTIEDEDDKPKTRSRKKKVQIDESTDAIVEKMQDLQVKGDEAKSGEIDHSAPEDSKHRDEGEDEEEVEDGSVEGLNVKLLPHQVDGKNWMIQKEISTQTKKGISPLGGILADDMGLGKTIQALSLILSNSRPTDEEIEKNVKCKIPLKAGKGTLIVAPLALIKQWESEIFTKVERFPKLKILVHHGASRTRSSRELRNYDVVITTYQTLTSEHDGSSKHEDGPKIGCMGVYWYRIILDEAHSIKNRNAKMTKAAYALDAVYRWCLTGTPMQNNLDELQSLICFLRIKPWSDLRHWREQITDPMKNGKGGLAMKRLKIFLNTFMKRRTKDILKQEGALSFNRGIGSTQNDSGDQEGFKIVARKVESVVVEFAEAEREFYNKLEARTERNLEDLMGGARTDYIGALVLLLRLRQICNHPELIKGSLSKEKDSLSSKNLCPPKRPRKQKVIVATEYLDRIDEMTHVLDNLTVDEPKCESCGSILDDEEIDRDMVHCTDCHADFKSLRRHSGNLSTDGDRKKDKKNSKAFKTRKRSSEKRPNRRIVDSDDEDEDTRSDKSPNKAGNSDTQNADSADDWNEDDSETGNNTPTTKSPNLDSSSEDNSDLDSDTDSNSDSDTDSTTNSISDIDEDCTSMPSTKIKKLLSILAQETPEHKVIIFSEFTSMLDIIQPFLHRENYLPHEHYVRYDGKMNPTQREASLKALRRKSSVRVMLCSLRCGSLGLNLTAASRVVILEPFWNPFVEEQAIDRVHRLNQTQDVVVYKITIKDSVEERILELQEKKRQLCRLAVEGVGDGKKKGKKDGMGLSMQDILRLFRKEAESDRSHDDGFTGLTSGRDVGKRSGAYEVDGMNRGQKAGWIVNGGDRDGDKRKREKPKSSAALRSKWELPNSYRNQYDAALFERRW